MSKDFYFLYCRPWCSHLGELEPSCGSHKQGSKSDDETSDLMTIRIKNEEGYLETGIPKLTGMLGIADIPSKLVMLSELPHIPNWMECQYNLAVWEQVEALRSSMKHEHLQECLEHSEIIPEHSADTFEEHWPVSPNHMFTDLLRITEASIMDNKTLLHVTFSHKPFTGIKMAVISGFNETLPKPIDYYWYRIRIDLQKNETMQMQSMAEAYSNCVELRLFMHMVEKILGREFATVNKFSEVRERTLQLYTVTEKFSNWERTIWLSQQLVEICSTALASINKGSMMLSAGPPPAPAVKLDFPEPGHIATVYWNHVPMAQSYIVICQCEEAEREEFSLENFFALNDLHPGCLYTVKVAAVSDGGTGEYSRQLCFATAPEPPKNLEISLAEDKLENSLLVKFDDDNTVNKKYEIIATSLSDGMKIRLETDETSAKVDGLTPGERYTVCVFAVKNDVRSEPCFAKEPIRLLPSKVTNVDVAKISMLIYKISWNQTQGAETYMVRWKHNADDEMKEMSTAGTEYSLDKLTPGESYQIHVVAANTAGYGRCSETKSLNIGVIPPKKVTVQAKHNDGSVSLEVTFTNVTQKIKEYIVGDEHNLFYKVRVQGTHTVIRNLALGKTYRVYVKAVGKNGLESAKRLAAPVCIGPLGVSQRCSHPRQNQIPALLMGLTVADGVIYNRERDAPGQNCKYIPPGYHHQEKYRLSTFSEYPSDVPVKVTDMAAAGFYYTGYKDRVKCFSCGLAVENWMVGDDAMERRWHKTDCKMAAEQDTRNDPIPTPNFRSIFRLIAGKHNNVQGISSLALGHRNYSQAPQGSSGLSDLSGASSSSLPNEITDVTSNFRRVVNVTDSYPSLVLANVLSVEHENRLKSLVLKNEKDRRTTFLKWPSYPAPYLPSDLAKDGFFYLGNLDRTQCFSCSGVLRNWAPYDSVREQHAKHFPNCRIVRAMDSGNIPMTDEERRDADEADRMRIAALLPSAGSLVEPPDPTEEEQRHLAAYFPCRDAVNPHMSRIQKRIETFAQGWPRERIRAAPEAIAKAGFYFLGESDKTKCFYCNGGLQNWDPDDEPWTEHAKWFPGCEFVLRRKGVEFVRQLVESHPNLNRPYIRNPVSLDIPPRDVQRTSPQNSMETQQSRLNLEQVQTMGFSMERIQRAIQRKEASGGYANTQELILDLAEENDVGTENNDMETAAAAPMEHSNNIEHGPAPILAQAGNKREGGAEGLGGTSVKKTKTSTVNGVQDSDDRQMQESLNAFEQTDKCKRCKQNRAEVVLIPCGHLSACSNCALVIKRCPICDVKVASSMKVFRA